MRYRNIKIFGALSLIVLSAILFSCKKILDVDYKDVVTGDEHYQNEFDAESAFIGIVGLFLDKVAEKYVLLGELRGDLLDVTGNADEHMQQIALHQVDTSNPYTNPKDFYTVILSCNDALNNLEIMHEEEKITDETYDDYYSWVMTYHSYTYYLLALHFGSVPYFTHTIENIEDIENKGFPVLSFDEIIDSLILKMSSLPQHTLGYVTNSNAGPSNFINKLFFMGDLYLMDNNYREAIRYYRAIMDYEYRSYGVHQYKCSIDANPPHGYNYDFEGGFEYNWNDMFKTYNNSSRFRYEWIWYCKVEQRYEQTNSLVKWFSNSYGDYMLKPSKLSRDNWDNQFLINGAPGDLRGFNSSWAYENGQPVVQKYLYDADTRFYQEADVFMYRTGLLHLRAAEAINRYGYPDIALALLNTDQLSSDPAPLKHKGDLLVQFVDTTYDFEGNRLSLDHENKQTAYEWDRGVRGRVFVGKPPFTDMQISHEDSILRVEQIISDEYALEAAYEGDRWANLLRIANRREQEAAGTGGLFLSNAIADKYEASGQTDLAEQIKTKLKNQNNWFLPLGD